MARFRSRIGLKVNIEQALLVNEMFKLRDQKICLTLGKPISPLSLDKSHTDKEWAALIREHVYRLEKDPAAEFNR